LRRIQEVLGIQAVQGIQAFHGIQAVQKIKKQVILVRFQAVQATKPRDGNRRVDEQRSHELLATWDKRTVKGDKGGIIANKHLTVMKPS
jgi:hypothetical protein